MLKPPQMSIAILPGDNRIRDAPADSLLTGPAKSIFCALTPAGNCITGVNRDDGIKGRVQDQPRAVLGQAKLLFRLFACCDVRSDMGGRIDSTIPIDDWELLNNGPPRICVGCSKCLECHHFARPGSVSIVRL